MPPSADAYGGLPMDLHITAQGYHPYYSILEMRKEKSRDAARSRRGKENYEFYELAKMLPLPAAITTQLDKASIIRLCISYLKLRDFTAHGDPPWDRDSSTSKAIKGGSLRSRSSSSIAMDIFEQHQGTHILQSLDGFAFALSADGRFLYISETVSIYLGLSQVEMTGSSVFDYIHQQDHAELAEQLGINLAQSQAMASSPGSVASDEGSSSSTPGASTPTAVDRPLPVMTLNGSATYKGTDRAFCIRMKSTLTKRGCHFKSSGYRVVLVLSHLRPQYQFGGRGKPPQQPAPVIGMVAMAIALPPPSINEVRLESDMFVTRLTFEFRVAHCEPRVSELLDYTAEELTGKNMYTLCHGQDVQKLRKCHIDLINKGQVMSGYYRLMNKNGGYTWLQTCATVICNTKNSDEQSIICVNYVLSAAEYENCILDCMQMPNSGNLKPDDPSNSERGSSPDNDGRDDASSRDDNCTPKTTPEGRCSSRAGGDNSHGDHLTQLKHPDALRPTVERLPLREEPPAPNNGFELEPKPLELETDLSRYRDSAGGRAKKRRLLDPKSPPESPAEHRVTPTTPEGAAQEAGDKIDRPWRHSPPTRTLSYAPSSSTSNAMSVKELEDVMNKHLPSQEGAEGALGGGGKPPQRSTIQWIGGAAQTPTTTATLPASSLLRQIYVNRESVIRSSRPPYYGEGPQGPLPTPPGDSYSTAAPYQGAPAAYADTYSAAMTPPSSVSPRDKFHPGIADTAAFSEAAAAAAAAAIPHMHHYVSEGALQPLPLKPQVFVHPGGLDYGSPEHQQQGLYHASGFHLYHPGGKAGHHATNGTSWYPQPNT